MKEAQVIDMFAHRKQGAREENTERESLNDGKTGSVYARGEKLWVYFRYLNQTVREPVGLKDTPENRKLVRTKLDLVVAEIENGVFEFARRFPHSKKRDYFTQLEGGTIERDPGEITYGEYYKEWFDSMKGGMSASNIRDYECIAANHLLPYFGEMPFSAMNVVVMKKFHSHLKSKTNPQGKPLSNKTIQNVFIPLRVVVRDAMAEHRLDIPDPFAPLKLPAAKKFHVDPFRYDEWQTLMGYLPEWYRPYFEFAVNTGLRPSEQVALKWEAVYADGFNVELSRVRGLEKDDLKTDSSNRQIALTPITKDILARQKEISAGCKSPYVFVNKKGRPINQDKLREVWARAMEKSGLSKRRMYETRHTFASWALAAGETPEWVAKTLGHVDTSMVYSTYGRHIPNLTRKDGSAFERQYADCTNFTQSFTQSPE